MSDKPILAMLFFKIATTFWRENALEENLKSGASAGRGSWINSLLNALTGQVFSPVPASTI